MTPISKDSLLKKISSSKKGGSAGKVTTKLVLLYLCYLSFLLNEHIIHWSLLDTFFRDTGLHKLVFKVLLDGTEVAYYVDGQVVKPRVISRFSLTMPCISLVNLHSHYAEKGRWVYQGSKNLL